MDSHQIILDPVFTEKAMGSRAQSQYVFKVHPQATKIDIRRAVEKLFKVKVRDVNTVYIRPKKRWYKGKVGRTNSGKKAYIKLVEGQKIEELEV